MIHPLRPLPPSSSSSLAGSASRTAVRTLARSLAAVLALAAGTLQAADTPAYERALAAGKTKLDAGQVAAALGDFQQAVQADGSQYEGYFYLAVASYRSGNHAAASEYATAALAAAKDQDKARAQELIDAIRKAKETEDLARQGDEASGKGLNAKAADLYARAFRLSPDRGDIGLKAATLYATRLNRLFEAAVLFQDVIASGDATAATAAGSQLGALHAPLQALYRDELPKAIARGDVGGLELLSKAFPQEAQPRLEVAALQAAKGNGEAAAHWLGEAVRLGADFGEVQKRTVFLDLWEKGATAFKSFIGDAFGDTAVADMNKRLGARQAKLAEERRVAAENARNEQLAREEKKRKDQLAQQQTARENAARPLRTVLRAPVVAELDRLFQASKEKTIGSRGPAKFFGGYEKNWDEYHLSMGLEGSNYIVKSTQLSQFWKSPGTKKRHSTTFTVESFSGLTDVALGPVFDRDIIRRLYGPGERFYSLFVTVPDYSITTMTLEWDSVSERPGRSSTVNAMFVIKDVADAARIRALFMELKAIDSLSLEELQAKTGRK